MGKLMLNRIREARQRLSDFWAIQESSFKDVLQIYSNFEKSPKTFVEDIKSASLEQALNEVPDDIIEVDGDTATIKIEGPLVDKDDCATIFLGCTSYSQIIKSINEVEDMSEIEKVVFEFDSPGGMVAGVDDASIAISKMKKPTEARVSTLCASAAYWLASQCDTIVGTSATAEFGSLGVVIEYWDGKRRMEDAGFDKICITSTSAPDKRVDASTEEGERKIRRSLDEIEDVFFRRVASGRGLTKSDISEKFGRGGTMLSERALFAGMIDKADFSLETDNVSNIRTEKDPESSMTLQEFLNQNPEAKTEHDKIVQSAVEKAVSENDKKHEAQKKEDQKIYDQTSKFLSSDAYSEKIKKAAQKAINKEISLETFNTIVTLEDCEKESSSSDEAKKETSEKGETAPIKSGGDSGQESTGDISSEEDYQESVKRLRANR